jgi:HlyD family secretion protein
MSNSKNTVLFLVLSIGCAASGGCDKTSNGLQPDTHSKTTRGLLISELGDGRVVLAQGRLEPESGVVPIVARPGDRIEKIDVTVGKEVEKGSPLATLAGHKLLEAELAVAQAQLEEAKAQLEAEGNAANAKLEVAKMLVEKNRMQFEDATNSLEHARTSGGQLNLLKSRFELATQDLERVREASIVDSSGRRLATETQLRQQELLVQAAKAEYESAERDAVRAVKMAELAWQASQKEVEAARLTIISTRAAVPIDSAERKIELLQQQIDAALLLSPIKGRVISIDAFDGQPTTGMPIMQIADVSSMLCRAEVPVEDLNKIRGEARVVMNQGGLSGVITGKVESISELVGSTRINSLNPLDRIDFSVAHVFIRIDTEHLEDAGKLIHSQVEVAIDADASSSE